MIISAQKVENLMSGVQSLLNLDEKNLLLNIREVTHFQFVRVRTLREFLDHEIDLWFKAGEKEQPENRPLLKVSLDDFAADIHANGMNSKLVSMLGWNYYRAVAWAELEGLVFLLTVHPRFQSLPFSFRRVCDNDDYALHFVEQILSLRGGRIGFEEYDSEKHSGNCEFGGISEVSVSLCDCD